MSSKTNKQKGMCDHCNSYSDVDLYGLEGGRLLYLCDDCWIIVYGEGRYDGSE